MVRRIPIATLLLAFAASFASLAFFSYRQKSATWDEPIHLTTGYAALAYGDHRFDTEHPPFARAWAALPLLFEPGLELHPGGVDRVEGIDSRRFAWTDQLSFAHRFLYEENDADRLLYRARAMVVVLGILLGGLVFAWAYELGGPGAAGLALLFFLLEPNLMAHSSLVTTDLALTCFLFGTLYFLWRTCRRRSVANVIALTSFFVLAMVTKYSALLLIPVVALLLATATFRHRTLPARAAVGLFVLLGVASLAGIWAAYHFRFAPYHSEKWVFHLQYDPKVSQAVPRLASIVSAVDEHRLLPNAYTQGFLFSQAKATSRDAFLAGERSSTGWWYYFPVAFAVKTPIPLMLLSGVGAWGVLLRWRRRGPGDELYAIVPIFAVVSAAMSTNLNIGLRHILPIYPFLVLGAGLVAARWIDRHRIVGGMLVAALVLFWCAERARAYPHDLAFFNTLAGGPERGSEWLADSNLDWGQDLKLLARWLEEHEIGTVNLAYFGSADPRYYGIDAAYLEGSPFFIPAERIGKPKLPGYVAVSATELVGVYGSAEERERYHGLRGRKPVAVIGHSIFVFWVTRPWW